ncbi:MAG: hypothetical protein JO170_19950 [Verrucomicrobia bacterium]|nr:hypothetical protein [Verrucomicrobiota bacterium]
MPKASLLLSLAAFVTVAASSSSGQQSTGSTREVGGSVQADGKPIAGATVTLYAAGIAKEDHALL